MVENVFYIMKTSVLKEILADTHALYKGDTLYACNIWDAAIILDIVELAPNLLLSKIIVSR